jgi:oligopeptide/dipeptide ABC transporter ATP-binding protein
MIIVTPDLGVVAEACQQVLVMYGGRVAEHGPVEGVFAAPQHPYPQALLSVVPSLARRRHARVLLQGEAPNPADIPAGCRFHPRCPLAAEACRLTDPPLEQKAGYEVVCIRVQSVRREASSSPAPRLAPCPLCYNRPGSVAIHVRSDPYGKEDDPRRRVGRQARPGARGF